MKNRVIKYFKITFLLLVIFLLSYSLVSGYLSYKDNSITVNISYKTNTEDFIQVFYIQKGTDIGFSENNSSMSITKRLDNFDIASFNVPSNTESIRIDFGSKASVINVDKIEIRRLFSKHIITPKDILEYASFNSFILNTRLENNTFCFETVQGDPFLIFKNNIDGYISEMEHRNTYFILIFSILLTLIFLLAWKVVVLASRIHLINQISTFIKDIFGARELIMKLAVNDFKTKYAGSYFGIVWAFVQPIITILTFWFVFQVGFRVAPVQDYPFILWFICGMIPWFFFSDATTNAMYSLLEYNYLVKKIVFKISILPLIKVISSLFIHLFFCIFIFAAFYMSGYMPSIYNIQVLYYLLCLFTLVIGISFLTSSIIIFFKDFGQIISIILQIGMWFTPIMWSYKMIPHRYSSIFKLNPMYYIVEGYRDSFINKIWFFEKLDITVLFWIINIAFFTLGVYLFKKLKPHFSDVL